MYKHNKYFTICIIWAVIIKLNENRLTALACQSRVNDGAKGVLRHFFGKDKKTYQENQPLDETLNWSTSDWITKHNYSLQLQHVVTLDGYNLTLHRMPRPGHRPILLMHGLLTSSLAWVIMGPTKSLAFQLFDNYYDVWLANMRGSPWSRNHTRFTARDGDFWSFSFHEWGRYDLPAIVDHIRDESSFQQVLLIGHSQALNAILVMCSLQPQYNERLQFVQALAPTLALKGRVKFSYGDVRKLMKYIKNKYQKQEYELLPRQFMRDNCLNSSKMKQCKKWLNLLMGSGQQEKISYHLLFGQLLQGTSLKEVRHLQQIWKSGDFVAYDYEPAGNLQVYGSVEPLNYDLHKISVPIILYYGATDALASDEGVHYIYARLLNSVKGVYQIAATKFNHLDFFIAADLPNLVNSRLLKDLEMFLESQLKYVIE